MKNYQSTDDAVIVVSSGANSTQKSVKLTSHTKADNQLMEIHITIKPGQEINFQRTQTNSVILPEPHER